jgi:hypothetical protein
MAWTDTQTEALVDAYGTEKDFASAVSVMAEFGKSEASVRMKLVKMGLYVKATTTSNVTKSDRAVGSLALSKANQRTYDNDALVHSIAKELKVEKALLNSLGLVDEQTLLVLLNVVARRASLNKA